MKYTKKLHHENPFLASNEAEILDIDPRGIMLSASVGYAEQGGQISDSGSIFYKGKAYDFSETHNVEGRTIFLSDFPVINVNQKVYHKIDETLLDDFKVGDTVKISINRQRRYDVTRSHSAIHLVLMGVESIRPGAYNTIKGCSIRELTSRLDFSGEKFSEDDLMKISDYTNNLIVKNLEMEVTPHPKEEDAWFWRLHNYKIGCGGTHLYKTGDVGTLIVKKKNMGKGLSRISCELVPLEIPEGLFIGH